MPIQIRLANDDDYDLLVQMHVDSWRVAYKGLVPEKYLNEEVVEERQEHWKEKLPFQGQNRSTAIAYDDTTGQSVGFVLSEYDQAVEKEMIYVDHLHVLPGWQGFGIGKKLLQNACDWTRSKDLKKVYLYVLEQNTQAIKFYENRGWIHDGDILGQMTRDRATPTRRYVLSLSE
jgi:ribosomal protein S18 acetylase RimI-like enzyme